MEFCFLSTPTHGSYYWLSAQGSLLECSEVHLGKSGSILGQVHVTQVLKHLYYHSSFTSGIFNVNSTFITQGLIQKLVQYHSDNSKVL